MRSGGGYTNFKGMFQWCSGFKTSTFVTPSALVSMEQMAGVVERTVNETGIFIIAQHERHSIMTEN